MPDKKQDSPPPMNELVVYRGSDPKHPVHIAFDGETMWFSQEQIAALFGTSRPNIVQHIQNIYKEGELDPNTTSKKILQVVEKRPGYGVTHYNLDVVISVGYRVSSKVATKFRQWATALIKERVTGGTGLGSDAQRVMISDRIAIENKDLIDSATKLGATDIAVFLNAGYQGMYQMRMPDIKKKKGLGKDKLLDRAGITELAANEFRITQTAEMLKQFKEEDQNMVGNGVALTTHWKVGKEVRDAIGRIGGEMPEDLAIEPDHIKDVKKRIARGKKSLPKLPESDS